ncbi:alpha/beta hydrolase-fold protein [Chryseobacterium paludis]|uniref:alpha/beta hydrolase-fold protein n=1 Tax=Chryseobacterium paludis TaxID=2956784 RepID=UPI0021C1DEBD|nr:alpha/beta hydrolase-fold protein [Chryseobacterium paludis]
MIDFTTYRQWLLYRTLLVKFILIGLFINLSSYAGAQNDELPKRNQKKVVITSKILNEQRTLWIYTPSNYEGSNEKYPVLYLLDPDQNFAYVTELERFLSDRYRIPQLIVVGVVNNDRIKDFTPIHSLIFNGKIDNSLASSGGGKYFLRFVKDELIPYVNKNYRTEPYRILSGHSLGGLFAVYCKEEEPDLFQSEIVISPAIYGGNMEILGRFSGFLKEHPKLSGYMPVSLGEEPGGKMAVDSLVGQLKRLAPKSFKWQYNSYKEEDHFSVGYKSMYDGLRFIYKDWFINPQDTTSVRSYRDIQMHFQKLTKEFGYSVQPGEDFMNESGYQRLKGGHIDQAIEIFAQNVKDHPNSSNAHDSLGEAYFLKGDNKRALDHYKRSVLLNPKNENGKEMIIKIKEKY